jgi:hypothetical protein
VPKRVAPANRTFARRHAARRSVGDSSRSLQADRSSLPGIPRLERPRKRARRGVRRIGLDGSARPAGGDARARRLRSDGRLRGSRAARRSSVRSRPRVRDGGQARRKVRMGCVCSRVAERRSAARRALRRAHARGSATSTPTGSPPHTRATTRSRR